MNKETAALLASLEHLFIPKWFYDNERDESEPFIKLLHENPSLLFDVFSIMCKDHNQENPFSKEEFSSETYSMDPEKEWFGTLLKFPKPEPAAPHCYEMYLFHDKDLKYKAVFALEAATSQEGEPGKVIGYLNEQGEMRSFGGWPLEEEQDFFAGALELYKKILDGEV